MTNYRDNLDTYGVKDMNKFRRQDRYGDMRWQSLVLKIRLE
jgi:hypothetical protein